MPLQCIAGAPSFADNCMISTCVRWDAGQLMGFLLKTTHVFKLKSQHPMEQKPYAPMPFA